VTALSLAIEIEQRNRRGVCDILLGAHCSSLLRALAKTKELIKEARYRGEKIVLLSATDQRIVDDQALVTLAALRGAGLNVELQAND
jgi:hypothetical protein